MELDSAPEQLFIGKLSRISPETNPDFQIIITATDKSGASATQTLDLTVVKNYDNTIYGTDSNWYIWQ